MPRRKSEPIPAPETPLDTSRTWTEFEDPADPEQRFRVDLSWLCSSWTCLFGSGCPGIYADRPDDGCCTLGAHFTDQDDIDRVAAVVTELTPQQWQHHPGHGRRGTKNPAKLSRWTSLDGKTRMTKVVDGACIFLNRPGFGAGAGCALHQVGVSTGRAPHTVKPDVCWQLPIRRAYRTVTRPDGTSYLEITITEFDRRGWGAGGHDLDWYCSANPAAHVAREPLFRSARPELIELIGEAAYAVLEVRCNAHLASLRIFRTVEAKKLLPLFVHPATVAAKTVGGRKR